MFFEQIDENMLCRGYWVTGTHDEEFIICIKEIHKDGIMSNDGRFFLFQEVKGIVVSHEWLLAAGFEHLTEGTMREEHGAYYLSGFLLHCCFTNMLWYSTKMKYLADCDSYMNCSIFIQQ